MSTAATLPRPRLDVVLAPLDRALGRVTTYRLVLLLLAALAAIALVMSITDTLFYEPTEMLASAAVLLGVSYGSGRLIAPLFRVTPHGESALITGLLLFFIFWPSSETGELLHLAAAALAATLSKYVVAWRGRHVLNPAAAGALLVGVLELTTSGWWVGGKELLPYVVVAGLLVLYRTRRLTLAAVFVVVAVAVRVLDSSQATGDAITATLESGPVLFFAAFMLTEPLTLPARRWQQLGVAVVVGVLFALAYEVGPFVSTPELALIVGNLVAFALVRRTGVRLRFRERRPLGPTTAEYVFEPVRPVRFAPGQYAELAVPHGRADRRGVRRSFTIASAPADDGTIAFGIREAPEKGSSYKRELATLEPGSVLTATTVAGDFVLPDHDARPELLVAGGIGVTPFVSRLRADGPGAGRDAVLVYGVTPGEGVPYRDELAASGVPVVLVTPDAPADLPDGWSHVAADRITDDVLRRAVPDLTGRRAWVSGPPAMVDAVRSTLRGLGVRRVRTDHFAGY